MNNIAVGIVGVVMAIIVALALSNKSKSNKLNKAETELKNAKTENAVAEAEKRAQTAVVGEAIKVVTSQKENAESAEFLRSAIKNGMTVEDAIALARKQIEIHTEKNNP